MLSRSILFCLIALFFFNETESFFAAPLCGLDLCQPQTGVCIPLGQYQALNTSHGIIYFPNSVSTRLEPDPSGIPTPTCDGAPTCNTFCQTNACAGTPAYCANHSCISTSQCTCDMGVASLNSYVVHEGTELLVTNQLTYPLSWCNLISKKRSVETDVSQNCTLYLVDNFPIINFRVVPEVAGFIKASFQGETRIIQYTQGVSFAIPDAWTHATGTAYLEVITSSGYCATTYQLIARTTCVTTDCVLCSQFWSNWQCIPSSYRSAMLWMTILFIILLICLLPWIGWVLYVVMSFVWNLLCCCFSMSRRMHKTRAADNFSRFWADRADRVKYYFDTNKDTDSDVEATETVTNTDGSTTKDEINVKTRKTTSRRITGYSGGIPIYATIICCIALSVPGTLACTGGLSVGSTSNLCTMNGTNQVCTTSFNLVGSVSGIGDQFCFTLTSPVGDTWTGMVQHIGVTAFMTLNTQYYTAAWSGVTESAHWCDGTTKCSGGCSGTCSNRLCNGALGNTMLNLYPGISQCHSSCGCVTCGGCFLCTPSCEYSGFAIIPSNPVFQVASIGTITFQPSVWVSITGPGVSINRAVPLSAGAISVGNFTIQLNGAFQGPQLGFGTLSPICSTNQTRCWFTTVAPVNAVTSGIPGDIQGSTINSLSNPAQTFRLGSIYSMTPGDLGDSYIFANSGVSSTFSTWRALPAIVDGNLYTGNASGLVTNLTAPPPLLFSMTTPGGLTYTRTQNVVCPVFSITNASGCYSCTSGSQVFIIARSSCLSGIVTLTSNVPLVTTSLSLTTLDAQYTIQIRPTSSPITISLTLSSPFATSTQTFTFTPVFVTDVVNQTFISSTNATSGGESAWTSLGNFFDGLGTDLLNFTSSPVGIASWVAIGLGVVAVVFVILMIPRIFPIKSKSM